MIRPVVFALFVLGFFAFPTKAYASENFDASLHSSYTVNNDATTSVVHDVALTNNQSTVVPDQFSLSIGSTGIVSVRAADDRGGLPVTRSVKESSTTITIDLSTRARVGIGKTTSFSISYRNDDIASKIGRALELNVPRLLGADDISVYGVTARIPVAYGDPSSMTPQPIRRDDGEQFMTFVFDDPRSSGVSAIFGSSQVFRVTASYRLIRRDDSDQGVITLIPDTRFQRVRYDTITPKPLTIDADPDGNWLARFDMSGKDELAINASATVETFLKPTVPVPPGNPETYVTAQPFWDVGDEGIQREAKNLRSARDIYDFVRTTLRYDADRLTLPDSRRGAAVALADPTGALCTEFTDLFIALARAKGIPARELNGFAYTDNPKLRPLSLTQDILHAWPEYYDSDAGEWIPVDPTWGHTTGGVDYFDKLDLNHIVFTIHGQSSTSPQSVGFFKSESFQGKSVQVTPLSESFPENDPVLDVTFTRPPVIRTIVPSSLSWTVKNLGGNALYGLPTSMNHSLTTISALQPSISRLLPYESATVKASIRPKRFSDEGTFRITVTIGTREIPYDVSVTPFITKEMAVLIAVAAVGSAIVAAVRSRRLRVP